MGKRRSGAQTVHLAASEDVKRLFRHIDDHAVLAVLALKPTLAQLEEAVARASGADDIFAGLRPAEGTVARILELTAELDEVEDPEGR